MSKKRRARGPLLGSIKFLTRGGLSNRFMLVFLTLCVAGYFVGRRQMPDPPPTPYDQLFENLHVYSYRDSPSDSISHFVVDLTACGRAFKQFDVDSRRFSSPSVGYHYNRTIGGTHYRPLRLRGHVGDGLWFERPQAQGQPMAASQFDELYRKTAEYVRPINIATNVLGILSGYSVGYRLGTWGGSLCNPAVQMRILETPGIERLIAREAWRRVLLEPALTGEETDAEAFSSIRDNQRVYAGFYRLALRDSDGFIPREAARLAQAGQPGYARAMVDFANSVERATADTCDLASRDFRAIEMWAGMVYGTGHWAKYVAPAHGEERTMYLGALAYYGLAPPSLDERRIWIGSRALVDCGGVNGFVTDDIPSTLPGCPLPWRKYVMPGFRPAEREPWPVHWVETSAGEFSQLLSFFKGLGRRLQSMGRDAKRASGPPPDQVADSPADRRR